MATQKTCFCSAKSSVKCSRCALKIATEDWADCALEVMHYEIEPFLAANGTEFVASFTGKLSRQLGADTLRSPFGLALHNSGTELIVADYSLKSIVTLDVNTGKELRAFKSPDPKKVDFERVFGVEPRPEHDELYVTSKSGLFVLKHSDGTLIRFLSHEGKDKAELDYAGQFFMTDTCVYATDRHLHSVKVFSHSGELLTLFPEGQDLKEPTGICLYNEEIYVGVSAESRIQVYTMDGAPVRSWQHDFSSGYTISLLALGDQIWTTEWSPGVLSRFTPQGQYIGGLARSQNEEAKLHAPYCMCFLGDDVAVADSEQHTIKCYV